MEYEATGEGQSSSVDPKGGGLSWSPPRKSSGTSFLVEVVENQANDFGVGDEGESFHPGPAAGTVQGSTSWSR